MNYDEMQLTQLKEIAKERGLKATALKKAELIELLKSTEKKETAAKPAADGKKKETAKRTKTAKAEPAEKTEKHEKAGTSDKNGKVEKTEKTEKTGKAEKSDIPVVRETAAKPEQPVIRQEQPAARNDAPVRQDNAQRDHRREMPERPREMPERPREMRERTDDTQRDRTGMNQQPLRRPQWGNQQPQRMSERPQWGNQQPQRTSERPQWGNQQPQRMAENVQGDALNAPQVREPQPQQQEEPVKRYDPASFMDPEKQQELDSGIEKNGILEIMPDGFGFIRCDNFLPGNNDVYVSPLQIKRYGLRSGDIICGNTKIQMATEKFSALLYIKTVNGYTLEETAKRRKFENLTPVFPHERIHLETTFSSVAMRMVDLLSPIGKGQRGMIVSQPKSGKTTLLKEIANSITTNHPDMHLIILLIDERPEEVTDMKESIKGSKVEVIYSTFDELPENHKRVSEMVIERAKRLVEHGEDVVILLDSITRLSRAYNLTCVSSGRTLSGGLDPAALHMPKKFFGAARTMREGGSLTILATALVDTGSRMDDVVFEEFKGTGNMELVLDRNLSERRIFPAIDLAKSGTRRDDLLLSREEYEAMARVRRALNGAHPEDTTERLINMCTHTRNNREFVMTILKSMNP